MSARSDHVFAGCVFDLGARDEEATARAYEVTMELVERARHLHLDEVAWDTHSPAAALATASALIEAVPGSTAVLDMGAVEARFGEGRRALRFSEATHRVSALLRSHGKPGVFATMRFVDGCEGDDLVGWEVVSEGDLNGLIRRAAPAWDELDVGPRLAACVRWVDDAVEALEQGERMERLASLGEHAEQVMSTLVTSHQTHPQECAHILLGLSRWLRPLWSRDEAMTVCERLLEAGDGLTRSQIDGLKLLRGMQSRKRLDFDAATALLSELMNDEDVEPRVRARAAAEFGTAGLAVGAVEQGRRGYTLADAIGARAGLPAVRSHANRGLAVVEMLAARQMSPEADARIYHHLELAIEEAHEAGDLQEVLLAVGERANILSASDSSRSRERMSVVLELAQRLSLPHHTSVALGVLTDLELQRGRVVSARRYLEQARGFVEVHDPMGWWSFELRSGLVALFERDVDHADDALARLRDIAPRLDHPQVSTTTLEFALMLAVATGRTERVKALRRRKDLFHIRWVAICALADALAAAEEGRGDALEALVGALQQEHGGGYYHDEWHELIWRCALDTFPEELTPLRETPTVTVDEEVTWFIGAEGARVKIGHRPHIHNIFRALVQLHERDEGGGLDVFELSEIGWPGVSISLSSMSNRVYVAIANLRQLGLEPWLIKGPRGYALDPNLSVVRLRS